MNLVCLYYKTAYKPKMEAGWFITTFILSGNERCYNLWLSVRLPKEEMWGWWERKYCVHGK